MEKDINRMCVCVCAHMCMSQRRAALKYSGGSIQSVTPVFPTVWRELFSVHASVCVRVCACVSAAQKEQDREAVR